MAEGDIDYENSNNIDCSYEDSDGIKQRASLGIDPQVTGVLSADKDALVVSNVEKELIKNGHAYSLRQKVNVDGGVTAYFLVDISGFSGAVECKPVRLSSDNGVWDLSITSDFSYTLAETETPLLNRYSWTVDDLNSVKIYEDITGLVVSSEPAEYRVGTQSTNQSGGGGTTAGDQDWFMTQGNYYLISMTNSSGDDDSVLSVQLDFYEVD